MSLDLNHSPSGYYYQAGATAYIMDPSGTYSTGGASGEPVETWAVGQSAAAASPSWRTSEGDRTTKLKGQSTVEIEPERLAIQFTRWVRHDISFRICLKC
jgi:hypothetical protein